MVCDSLLGLFLYVSVCYCTYQQCPGKSLMSHWATLEWYSLLGYVPIYSWWWQQFQGKTVNATLRYLWHFISRYMLCHTVMHEHMFCMYGEQRAKTQPSIYSNDSHIPFPHTSRECIDSSSPCNQQLAPENRLKPKRSLPTSLS